MMMNLNSLTTIGSLILLAPWNCEAQIRRSSPHYRVRTAAEDRDLQMVQFNPLDVLLSFSDDGAQRKDEFYLDIFETPEILSNSDSPLIISSAMNFFLLEELDGAFDDIHTIENVSSEIVHLKTRNGTYVNASGIETNRIGTEARMKVIVSFDQTPSPSVDEVLFMLKYVMSDLSNFVTNLTGSVSSDNELSGVYEAIRREIREPVLLPPPDQNIVVDISEGEQGQGQPGENDDSSPNLIAAATVPIVIGVATLAAVLVFFAFRKEKPTESESSKASSVMMFDVENEIFSLDRSVESVDTKSPFSRPSPMPQDESSIQYSVSTGITDTPASDSVFSGIDSEYGSAISPKSMMTGFTTASASTIQASNRNKSKNKKDGLKSPVGSNSLFSFLDPIEDADEEDVDDFELTERAQTTLKTGVGQKTSDNIFSTSSTDPTEGIQSSSSSSPLQGTSIDIPSKIEDEAIEATNAQSDDPVSHVLADLENMETTIGSVQRDTSPVNQINSTSPTSPSIDDEKKDDNGGKSAFRVATKASNLMSGLFKGRQKSGSTPNSPSSSPTHEAKLSAPSSPMQQVGRHWLTSADNKPSRRIPTTPKIDVNVDYDMMLSHPSPSEEEYNYSSEFNDTINDSMQIVDRAPQSPDLDPTGGRRHAGDKIGGDGSALYQTSAMKPTDWSYRSSDADSVGSSTIDDEVSRNPSNNATPTNAAASETKESATASLQLMNDLAWLEQKIATVRGETKLTRSAPALEAISSDSSDENGMESHLSNDYTPTIDKDPSNIVCRDCFAPPGKLHIVIHSTKDGPAVHTVKDGSSLAGEIYPGDIIISVDNTDTRTCSAEDVMKMMASKGDKERKITVLRFLEET